MKNYDLVICFQSQAGIILAVMRWFFHATNPPFVLFDIEGIGRMNNPVIKKFLSRIISTISLFFYFASVQKEDYQKYFPDIIDRTKFLRWGVDLSRYQSSNEFKEDDIVISIGYQDSRFRDWETLIEAWRIISPRYTTKLVIVGRQGLSAKELGNKSMPDKVEFVEHLDLQELNNLTRKARFVVLSLPERRHSYAQMTLFGCMALGKAVIVSNVSGIIDCVKDGETAILSEKNDPDAMAKKIGLLLDSLSIASAIGKNAKEEVEKYYREDQMGDEIEKAITAILKVKQSTP